MHEKAYFQAIGADKQFYLTFTESTQTLRLSEPEHDAIASGIVSSAITLLRENVIDHICLEDRSTLLTSAIKSVAMDLANPILLAKRQKQYSETDLTRIVETAIVMAYCEKVPDHPFSMSMIKGDEIYDQNFFENTA